MGGRGRARPFRVAGPPFPGRDKKQERNAMAQGFRVAVAGAATTAGKEIIRILEERNFPVRTLAALETQGSLGTVVQYRDQDIPVQALKAESLAGADIAFFASTEKVSGEYARGIAGNG